MNELAVAAISALGAIIVAMISSGLIGRRRTKRVEAKQDELLAKVSTNQGLEPWQYLEMIGEVKAAVLRLDGRLEDQAELQRGFRRYVQDELEVHSGRLNRLDDKVNHVVARAS